MKIILPIFTFIIGLLSGIYIASPTLTPQTTSGMSSQDDSVVLPVSDVIRNKKLEKDDNNSSLDEANKVGDKTNSSVVSLAKVKDQNRTIKELDPIKIRLSAINKVVGLNMDEEVAVAELLKEGADHPLTLEDIIGAERAAFYYQQQRNSFTRSENEEIEKELYFYARRFGLEPEQETALFDILTEIKDQNRVNRGGRPSRMGATPKERLGEILQETRIYRSTLIERLKTVLNEQQYQAFLAYDAESVAADMEMWHSTGDE